MKGAQTHMQICLGMFSPGTLKNVSPQNCNTGVEQRKNQKGERGEERKVLGMYVKGTMELLEKPRHTHKSLLLYERSSYQDIVKKKKKKKKKEEERKKGN